MQIANIVANDATPTAQTFTALVPSSGTTPARWSDESHSTIPGHRRYLTAAGRNGSSAAVRRVDINFVHPFPITVDGREVVENTLRATVSVVVPQLADSTDLGHAAALLGNLLASTLIQEVNESGYAPT